MEDVLIFIAVFGVVFLPGYWLLLRHHQREIERIYREDIERRRAIYEKHGAATTGGNE